MSRSRCAQGAVGARSGMGADEQPSVGVGRSEVVDMDLEDLGKLGVDGDTTGLAARPGARPGPCSRTSTVLLQLLPDRGRASMSRISPHCPGSVGVGVDHDPWIDTGGGARLSPAAVGQRVGAEADLAGVLQRVCRIIRLPVAVAVAAAALDPGLGLGDPGQQVPDESTPGCRSLNASILTVCVLSQETTGQAGRADRGRP